MQASNSSMFSKYLSDDELMQVCSEEQFIKKILQFETALAKTQATLGMIPQTSAEEIAEALINLNVLPSELAEGTLQNGIPVVTLLSLVKEKLSADSQKHLHYGATSQDAMDTAQILIIKDAI